ncbi:unnamed protein product, partial [Ilex paraguariensis]
MGRCMYMNGHKSLGQVVGAATQAFGLSIRNELHEETRLDMWREMMMVVLLLIHKDASIV